MEEEEEVPTVVLPPENTQLCTVERDEKKITIVLSGVEIPLVLANNLVFVNKDTIEDIVGTLEKGLLIKFRLLLRKWIKSGHIVSYTADGTTKEDFMNNNIKWIDGLYRLDEIVNAIRKGNYTVGQSLIRLYERVQFQVLTVKVTQ